MRKSLFDRVGRVNGGGGGKGSRKTGRPDLTKGFIALGGG